MCNELDKVKEEIVNLIHTGEVDDEIKISKEISLDEIQDILKDFGFEEDSYDADGFDRWWYFSRNDFINQLVLHNDAESSKWRLYIEETMTW